MASDLRKRPLSAFDGLERPRLYSARMSAAPQRSDGWDGMGVGWVITATMLAGVLVWGGAGLLLDRLVGTTHVLLPIGMLVGAAGSTYIVYLRYGKEDRGDS
jgi:F0F1-type ATP synthase assembly protein I